MKTIPGVSRRRLLLAGAGTAGAIAAAATVAVSPVARDSDAPALPATKNGPERGGGYQLTQHVLRYYKTARV